MTKGQEQKLRVALHIVAWIVFLNIPAAFNTRRAGEGISRFAEDIMELPRWTNALLLLCIFYVNIFYAVPRLYLRQRYISFVLYLLLTAGVFVWLNDFVAPPEARMSPYFTPLGNSFNLFMYIIVHVVSFVLCLYQQWQQVKLEKLTTRISFLTAQINPHFLFNTLNSLYSLAIKKSDKTPEAIVTLSKMMRYSIDEGSRPLVMLNKELEYIESYMKLQSLRLTPATSVAYQVSGVTNEVKIVPFLLIPFVENAFKYGADSEHPSVIEVSIVIRERTLQATITNSKMSELAIKEKGTGLGIQTTRQRLELLYPGAYELHISDTPDRFLVTLQLQL